ncbi:MAG: radical SAM protein [Chloroflexi bacterium]|nr:radical SAM protein [Chloroflexota bacterium]
MDQEVKLHFEYENMRKSSSGFYWDKLRARREKLLERLEAIQDSGLDMEGREWQARSYPVLSILAPVMSTSEGKIEFPGDPMGLYSGLSYAVDQVVKTRKMGLVQGAPYPDLCPQWGYLPSAGYRSQVDTNGIRQYDGQPLNTDQTVFDPRVWNDRVRDYFVTKVLLVMRPKVVLISAVSPAHRYAIDIARTIRAHLPQCVIVLGGRHVDETIHFDESARSIILEPSSAVRKILGGTLEPVFDFLIAGDGYYALDLLMKIISLSMDIVSKTATVHFIIENLSTLSLLFDPLPGNSTIIGIDAGTVHAWPVASHIKLDLSVLPSPYSAFAIRAMFPIFQRDGRILRTAHFMVTNSCTYHCYFCSEGVTVVGGFLSFHTQGIQKALERVIEYIEYGAEAIFFDDSIFWGGNFGDVINFCRELIRIREMAGNTASKTVPVFGREIEADKILNLVWGAQFTVDLLASRRVPEEALLALTEMKKAGCTYIYIGIESMSASVIDKVHKNVNRKLAWEDRVRIALGMAYMAGISIGSSVLFGLDGETNETIEETICKVEELLVEDLLSIASPNILTYHPNTEITALHGMKDKLDYHSIATSNRPPYVYFEEAFPAVVSRNLTEDQIWFIHEQTRQRWGTKRNTNPMPDVVLREYLKPGD